MHWILHEMKAHSLLLLRVVKWYFIFISHCRCSVISMKCRHVAAMANSHVNEIHDSSGQCAKVELYTFRFRPMPIFCIHWNSAYGSIMMLRSDVLTSRVFAFHQLIANFWISSLHIFLFSVSSFMSEKFSISSATNYEFILSKRNIVLWFWRFSECRHMRNELSWINFSLINMRMRAAVVLVPRRLPRISFHKFQIFVSCSIHPALAYLSLLVMN